MRSLVAGGVVVAAIAASGAVGCGGDDGTLVTASLPADLAETVAGQTLSIEWFVAPLDETTAAGEMRRSHAASDAYEVAASALVAGETLRLDSEEVGSAKVALVVRGEVTGGGGGEIIAFGARVVATGPGALRGYTLELAPAAASDAATRAPDCGARDGAAGFTPVLTFGDPAHELGSCLRWVDDGGYHAMVWPDDRDCDGALVDGQVPVACSVDGRQCEPDVSGDGSLDPALDDGAGADRLAPPTLQWPTGVDVTTCSECVVVRNDVAVTVPCDCEPMVPGNDDGVTGYLVPEACDGNDNDCDGEFWRERLAGEDTLCTGADLNGDCLAGRLGCMEVEGDPGEGMEGCQLDPTFASTVCDAPRCTGPSECPDESFDVTRLCEIAIGPGEVDGDPPAPCENEIRIMAPSGATDTCAARLWTSGTDGDLELRHNGVALAWQAPDILCNEIYLHTGRALPPEQHVLIEIKHQVRGHSVIDLRLKHGNDLPSCEVQTPCGELLDVGALP